MSNAWILAPIVVIDVLFVFNLAAILDQIIRPRSLIILLRTLNLTIMNLVLSHPVFLIIFLSSSFSKLQSPLHQKKLSILIIFLNLIC
jgi:hypothetical protein